MLNSAFWNLISCPFKAWLILHENSEGSEKHESVESLDVATSSTQAVCVLVELGNRWDTSAFRKLVLILISKYRYFWTQNKLFHERLSCLGFIALVFRVHSCGTNLDNFMILLYFNELGPQYFLDKRKDTISLQFKILEDWLLIDCCLCVLQWIPIWFFCLFCFQIQILFPCSFISPSYVFSTVLFYFCDTEIQTRFFSLLLTHYPCFQSLFSANVCTFSCALIPNPSLPLFHYSHWSWLFQLFLPWIVKYHRTILFVFWCKSWFNLSESWHVSVNLFLLYFKRTEFTKNVQKISMCLGHL